MLKEFKKVLKKYYYFRNDDFIDVFFGTIFANRLDAKPVWLYFVGPPSCGKSMLAETVSEHLESYCLSVIRPTSLVSGFGTVRKRDESLLPKLDGKVLLLTDFTAMLNMRYSDLLEVLGILRCVYDGKGGVAFGTGTVNHKAKFGLVACVTEAIDRHKEVLADLGERFLMYRFPKITRFEAMQRAKKMLSLESVEQRDREVSAAANAVLDQEITVIPELRDYDKLKIIKVCQVVAVARCHIHRDRWSKEPDIPSPEVPVRLPDQLGNLAIGIAMARGKRVVGNEEVRLAQKVGLDCISKKRLEIIKSLLTCWPDYGSVEYIGKRMSFEFQGDTIRRWLDDMQLLGLVEEQRIVNELGGTTVRWRIREGDILKGIFK